MRFKFLQLSWVWKKIPLISASFGVWLCQFFLSACGQIQTESLTGNAANGPAVMAAKCASCHGADAKGAGVAPSLIARDITSLKSATRNGKGSMQSIGTAELSDQELNDLVAYLITLTE